MNLNKSLKKAGLGLLALVAILYISVCMFLYLKQEQMLFFPEVLESNYPFQFDRAFEELTIQTTDNTKLNALLFKADSSRGVVFYLHGNSGSIKGTQGLAALYAAQGHDFFALDYRGFGKSEGALEGEDQLVMDAQIAYDKIKSMYSEDNIVIVGYSLGSGIAARLASENSPKQLVLQAPYYSLVDLMQRNFSFIPTFLLKYQFRTHEYLGNCKMPITIFHGVNDRLIPMASSEKLKVHLKENDTYVALENCDHNHINQNEVFQQELIVLLAR